MSRGEGTFSWTTLTLQLLGSCFLYVCESAILKCCPWRTMSLQSTRESWGTHEPPTEVFQEEQIRSAFMYWVFEKLQESLVLSIFLCCCRFLGFLLSQSYPFQSPLSRVLECSLSHLVSCVFLGIIVWVTSQRFALHLVRGVDLSKSSFRR